MAVRGHLSMVTDQNTADLMSKDWNELSSAATNLVNHAILFGGLGFGTSFLQWAATVGALYLLILDRTNWRTNILTALLIPYLFFCLPAVLFDFLSGEVGKWVALAAVVLRLFFPKHFPDWLEMPAALQLLLVVAPTLFAETFRGNLVGTVICLLIACYLLQEHIRAAGGFKDAFCKPNGASNTFGIVVIFVYPLWCLVVHFL